MAIVKEVTADNLQKSRQRSDKVHKDKFDVNKVLSDLIDQIKMASDKGEYFIIFNTPKAAAARVNQFLKSKKYLVVADSKNHYRICISWYGSKIWIKGTYGYTKRDQVIADINNISASILSTIRANLRTDQIAFINPSDGNISNYILKNY